jgi:leucyl-tRNA synthetase
MGRTRVARARAFPVADLALLVEDTVTCVIQIKGKVRDRVEVPADISESTCASWCSPVRRCRLRRRTAFAP